ncbi:hypothetical protein E2562_031469, partial [Oryza meyeriana var. granulata]
MPALRPPPPLRRHRPPCAAGSPAPDSSLPCPLQRRIPYTVGSSPAPPARRQLPALRRRLPCARLLPVLPRRLADNRPPYAAGSPAPDSSPPPLVSPPRPPRRASRRRALLPDLPGTLSSSSASRFREHEWTLERIRNAFEGLEGSHVWLFREKTGILQIKSSYKAAIAMKINALSKNYFEISLLSPGLNPRHQHLVCLLDQ